MAGYVDFNVLKAAVDGEVTYIGAGVVGLAVGTPVFNYRQLVSVPEASYTGYAPQVIAPLRSEDGEGVILSTQFNLHFLNTGLSVGNLITGIFVKDVGGGLRYHMSLPGPIDMNENGASLHALVAWRLRFFDGQMSDLTTITRP